MTTAPVVRGCGTRIAGGTYIEVRQSPNGHPIEEFLCDPPKPIDEAEIGMSARGMTVMITSGRSYLLDHVGGDYPNAADIIEEGRRHGFSRRIQRTVDFGQINPGTRLALVHPKAIIEHHRTLEEHDLGNEAQRCPQWIGYRHCGKPDPGHGAGHCARLWWQDIPNRAWDEQGKNERNTEVRIGSTRYYAYERPRTTFEARYRPGIIAILPISGIAVVKDREGGTHRAALERAEQARVPVELTEL